jgi:hypothetical protein
VDHFVIVLDVLSLDFLCLFSVPKSVVLHSKRYSSSKSFKTKQSSDNCKGKLYVQIVHLKVEHTHIIDKVAERVY